MTNSNEKFDLIDYINFTSSTWNKKSDPRLNVQHAILGLIDECGEIAGWYKKVIGYDQKFQPNQQILEIGDYLFYLVRFCEDLGLFDDMRFVNQVENEINSLNVTVDRSLTYADHSMILVKNTFQMTDSFNKFDVKFYVISTIATLRIHARLCGTNLPNVALANRKKLNERHLKVTGGYNPNHLETRDRDAELKASTDDNS